VASRAARERSTVGLIYRSPALYRLAMSVLDRERKRRDRLVVDAIAPGSSVVDLCCGDASIAPALLDKGCSYVGLDVNERFVAAARKRGLDVRPWDAATMEVPEAEVVCLLASLYQFVPDERKLLERMVQSARRLVVIAEPVRNWATSGSTLLRAVARRATQVNGRTFEHRLSEADLDRLAAEVAPGAVRKETLDRDVVLFLET
jgi:trans-aconitate methyltransferase